MDQTFQLHPARRTTALNGGHRQNGGATGGHNWKATDEERIEMGARKGDVGDKATYTGAEVLGWLGY